MRGPEMSWVRFSPVPPSRLFVDGVGRAGRASERCCRTGIPPQQHPRTRPQGRSEGGSGGGLGQERLTGEPESRVQRNPGRCETLNASGFSALRSAKPTAWLPGRSGPRVAIATPPSPVSPSLSQRSGPKN